jgi:hypothetical protein
MVNRIMSTPDIKSYEYFEVWKARMTQVLNNNSHPELVKIFRDVYGKIYESIPSHNDPIQINNLFFTKKFKEKANMNYSEMSEDEMFTISSGLLVADSFLKSNFPLYFLSKDFVENAMDADIDKNILFGDLTLPFKSVFYILPKNMFLNWFSLTYVPERDDYFLFGVTADEQITSMFIRDLLTSPDVDESTLNRFNSVILFAISTVLFHKTSGFGQKVVPITPLPVIRNVMKKLVFRPIKKVSPNVLTSPKIAYRKTEGYENSNEQGEFEGYKQIPSHIRIIKDKKTGEVKIVSVSSSEVNPEKRREGVEFQKNKMTDKEIAELVKARRDDIISRMKKRGFSEDEINAFLKQNNLNESSQIYSSFKSYFLLKETIL